MGINKVVYSDDVLIDLTEDTVNPDVMLSGYTAHSSTGEKVQGNMTLDDIRDDITSLKSFTPDAIKNNRINNVLHVDTGTTSILDSDYMKPGVIATEDASTLLDSPITSGAFYATREVQTINLYDESVSEEHRKIIVRLFEVWPLAGRIWINTYNSDVQYWSGWACHDPRQYPITTNAVCDLSAHPEYWNFPSNIICVQTKEHTFDFHISMKCTKFTANQGFEMFSTAKLKEMGGGSSISWDWFNTRVFISSYNSQFNASSANGVHGMVVCSYDGGSCMLFCRRYNANNYDDAGGWGSEVDCVYVPEGFYQVDMYNVVIK